MISPGVNSLGFFIFSFRLLFISMITVNKSKAFGRVRVALQRNGFTIFEQIRRRLSMITIDKSKNPNRVCVTLQENGVNPIEQIKLRLLSESLSLERVYYVDSDWNHTSDSRCDWLTLPDELVADLPVSTYQYTFYQEPEAQVLHTLEVGLLNVIDSSMEEERVASIISLEQEDGDTNVISLPELYEEQTND